MKIIHILYSGMGGHADVVFPKIQNDQDNKNIIFFVGIEKVFNNYILFCKKYKINYYYFDYQNKFSCFFKIFKILNIIRPNIIFSHIETVFILLFFKILNPNVKLISFQHVSLKIKKFKNHLVNLSEYFFFDKIIFLSESYKNQVLKQYSYLKLKHKSHVIPTGIINLKFTSKKINKKKIVIGMSTRFVKGKKIFNLINLIKYNNQTIRLPIYLSIIGKGEDYKKIKKYIKDIKLDEFIHLTTLETERELNTWNSNLFIYVHFSEGETLSTSIIRALRAGKPIIASNVVGIKEMIKNKNNSNGYLVNDENYKQILKLIKKILENKKLYNELSKNSLKLFKKKYSLELSLIKYKKLINLFV